MSNRIDSRSAGGPFWDVRPDKAPPMSKPAPRVIAHPSSPLSAVLREPAGIVCLALLLAVAALAVRIAGAW